MGLCWTFLQQQTNVNVHPFAVIIKPRLTFGNLGFVVIVLKVQSSAMDFSAIEKYLFYLFYKKYEYLVVVKRK